MLLACPSVRDALRTYSCQAGHTTAHSFIHYFIGAVQLTLFMTAAVDRNALSDVCGLNLQYHCKTASRQSKVYSVGLRRRL